MDCRRICGGQIKASIHQVFPSTKRNEYLWCLLTHPSAFTSSLANAAPVSGFSSSTHPTPLFSLCPALQSLWPCFSLGSLFSIPAIILCSQIALA